MAQSVKTILQELYQLDPELQKYETELTKIIKQVMTTKPDTKFDKKFAQALRSQLLAKAGEPTSQLNSLTNIFDMKKLFYALGGAALTALVLVPILNNPQTQNLFKPGQSELAFDTTLQIDQLGKEAFGSLLGDSTGAAVAQEMAALTDSSSAPQAAPAPAGLVREQSGGGSSATTAIGFGGGGGTPVDAKMIAPDFTPFTYVYTGDELSLEDETVEVLKRLKGFGNQSSLNSLLSSLNLDLFNLGSFGQSTIDNLTLTQTGRYGYMINIQANEGYVSINKNWIEWPQLNCTDDNCDNLRIRENQMPSDAEAIRIANDFIAKHNISLAGYGEPEIQQGWQVMYQQTSNKADFWFPDTVNVVYPLEINGQQVYEQYGSDKYGLVVNIDVREKRAAGISNLTNQNYQSSSYTAVTDVQKILGLAERGGLNGAWWGEANDQTQTVELGTPTKELIRYYRYHNNQTEELYVPALVFPVTKRPANAEYYNIQQIVVPLVAELLDNQGYDGPIRILPVEPGGTPATAPSAGAVQDLPVLEETSL